MYGDLPRNKSQKSVSSFEYICAIKSLEADFGEFLPPDATNSPCTPSTSDMIGSIRRETEYKREREYSKYRVCTESERQSYIVCRERRVCRERGV